MWPFLKQQKQRPLLFRICFRASTCVTVAHVLEGWRCWQKQQDTEDGMVFDTKVVAVGNCCSGFFLCWDAPGFDWILSQAPTSSSITLSKEIKLQLVSELRRLIISCKSVGNLFSITEERRLPYVAASTPSALRLLT